MTSRKSQWTNSLLIMAILFLAAACVVWSAPDEKTLGSGIKWVYVHVSFIWTGMLAFVLSGLMGLLSLLRPRETLARRMQTVAAVAWVWFAVGLLLSMVAAKVNWGAVYWDEPRMQASLRFIVASAVFLLLCRVVENLRIKGGLLFVTAFFLMWSFLGIPQVLHPKNPIVESNSMAIKATFLATFVLNVLAAGVVVRMFRTRANSQSS